MAVFLPFEVYFLVICLFLYKLSFFFFFLLDNTCDSSCFQDNVTSSPIRAPVIKSVVITWSLTSGFQVCWKGHCLESALTFCVQIDHVTPHSNWLDFVYFFPCGVFCQWSASDVGFFCTDEILFLNRTKIITF